MSSRTSTVASDDIFSRYSVSSRTASEPCSVKKPISRPAVQQYESEIEKCIRAGLIDANMPPGPGLPPLPAFKDSTTVSRRSSSDASTSLSRQRTIDDLPISRRPSAEVVGGLQRLATMLQSCTGREQNSIKENANAYWDDLSVTEGQSERETATKWKAIESSWRRLDGGLEAGRQQTRRALLREDRDTRRRQWIDMKQERDRYLDQWLVDLDEQQYEQDQSTMLAV